MTENVRKQKGLYFEEFEVGMELETRGRTITETDIVNFAGLSGDFNPMHTDAAYAATTPFGQRVAHGLLGLSVASGLSYQMGFLEGTVLAFRSLEWKFSKPVLIGDTIRARVKIVELRELKRLGGGEVTFEILVLNQKDEIAHKGTWTVLVAGRPAS
jgi:acyl dehydratase